MRGLSKLQLSWDPLKHTYEENLQWSWLRAVEWGAWPAFLSQPIIPLFLPFIAWWELIGIVIILTALWSFVSYRYVSISLVIGGLYFVLLKWIVCPLVIIYLITKHIYGLAVLAFIWPFLAGFLGTGSQNKRIQNMFMAKLGYEQQMQSEIKSDFKKPPDVSYSDEKRLEQSLRIISEKHKSGIYYLALIIVNASTKCGHEFVKYIEEKFGKGSHEADLNRAQVHYEFLFFFTHLTMRYAFSLLGNEKRNKLQELLLPTLEELSTAMWFGHWPEKVKYEILNSFFHNMNVAEFEYSKCKKLTPEKDESPKDTLFWELDKNIARLSGYENDPAVLILCNDVSIDNFKNMKLDKLIDTVSKEI